jgi:hypothetical protein
MEVEEAAARDQMGVAAGVYRMRMVAAGAEEQRRKRQEEDHMRSCNPFLVLHLAEEAGAHPTA